MIWAIHAATRIMYGRVILAALIAIVVSGCTTIPAKEFASYQEAFAKARSAGEEVLLDYGAAAKEVASIRAQDAAAKSKPKQRADEFDAAAAARQGDKVDAIAVRLKAWDVVARYNDLLTALAEGKAADELAGAVDGLSSSLGGFPIAEVASTAAEVSGYLAPLRALALQAVREKSRRDFVAAVGKGSDLINQKFIKLLRDDTKDFFNVRWGLNDLQYAPLVDSVGKLATTFSKLAKGLQSTAEVQGSTMLINAELARLPQEEEEPAVAPVEVHAGSKAPTAQELAQLDGLADQVKQLVAQALAKDAELEAYRDVLVAYTSLLGALEQSIRNLQLAAQNAEPTIPRGDELQRAVILLREAYIAYKDK